MKYVLFFVFAFGLTIRAHAADSQFDSIVKFFEDNIQGNTIKLSTEGPSYDEKYKLRFERTITFGKLRKKGDSFYIDLTGNIERTTIPVDDKDKTEQEKPYSEKTNSVRRLELSKRLSSGKVVGFMRTIKEDGEKVYADGDVVIGEFIADKNELKLTDSNVGYVDETFDGETYHAVSRSNEYLFHLDEDKNLVLDQKMSTFLVDPDTLEMTLKSEHDFTSTQVPGLPRLFSK